MRSQIPDGKSHFSRIGVMRLDHLGQEEKIAKPEKIGEKNQRPKMRTEGQSQRPPPKLHLQVITGNHIQESKITDWK